MRGEYQVDHLLTDQLEVEYKLFPSTTESNGNLPELNGFLC